ncbi:predicted protein [Histoplasma capsulatum G186AR]|uniref:Uncharacterized protein n=1 Tax=Ajellomyces capsulatus (strain G186AR / H82 / ATCC MYA-2454 / RMSCC 2432) TaxID=447093 RepID=C0NXC6_AJECG|nr:uncharacterized protein HCBG_08118 [Histoplasma capsulatum G186AR]EEH03992.1 predicted protein [Histoplasma capsulatum G186AR]
MRELWHGDIIQVRLLGSLQMWLASQYQLPSRILKPASETHSQKWSETLQNIGNQFAPLMANLPGGNLYVSTVHSFCCRFYPYSTCMISESIAGERDTRGC